MSRWLLRNLGTLGLALLLALVAWVVAVHEEDPLEERAFSQLVPVEVIHLPAGTIVVGEPGWQTSATLRAPRSIWGTLTAGEIHARADLSGLGPGPHDVQPLFAHFTEMMVQAKASPATKTKSASVATA